VVEGKDLALSYVTVSKGVENHRTNGTARQYQNLKSRLDWHIERPKLCIKEEVTLEIHILFRDDHGRDVFALELVLRMLKSQLRFFHWP
jgi:hypothetical protein